MVHHTFLHPGPRHHRRDPRVGRDGTPLGWPDHRGPGGGRGRGRGAMVGRGEVRPLILATLTARPMHGYEVIQELEAQSGGRWRPSAGSIYPTLQLLADEGLVSSEEIDGRRIYALTDEGRTASAASPAPSWDDRGPGRGNDVRHLARQVAEAAMQVQRVGSRHAGIAAEQILLDTRARLYGLLAADGAVPASGEAAPSDASDQ